MNAIVALQLKWRFSAWEVGRRASYVGHAVVADESAGRGTNGSGWPSWEQQGLAVIAMDWHSPSTIYGAWR